jgi:cyclic pyranopterin phosphate synthase
MKPLIDRFGRIHTYLRVSITDRCNLRCIYCMPPEGIESTRREEILTYEEIIRVVRLLAGMGITKVRLTGGEPLVRRDVPDLVRGIAAIPGIQAVGMTTNSVLLGQYAQPLREAGLDLLNVSLDTLRPDRYEAITRRADFDAAVAGIEAALDAGFESLKLNMVVMGGINEDEILDFVEFARNRPIHLRFLEFMPFKSNGWAEAAFVSYSEMRATVESRHPLLPLFEEKGPAEVSKEFRIPGFAGTVGFITSMSDDFCRDCNRLRLLANGDIKSCLFHPPEENLRLALRSGASDETLEWLIRSCVDAKLEKHAPVEELIRLENNPMIAIGG